MATLRLVKRREPAVSPEAPPERHEPPPRSSGSYELLGPGDARIRLASLPAPLRAVVRDRSEDRITIAAELPWLSIGTALTVQSSGCAEQSGSVQSFAVEVTATGSACLLILAKPSPAGAPLERLASAPSQPVHRWPRWPLVVLAMVVGAAIGGYFGVRQAMPDLVVGGSAPR